MNSGRVTLLSTFVKLFGKIIREDLILWWWAESPWTGFWPEIHKQQGSGNINALLMTKLSSVLWWKCSLVKDVLKNVAQVQVQSMTSVSHPWKALCPIRNNASLNFSLTYRHRMSGTDQWWFPEARSAKDWENKKEKTMWTWIEYKPSLPTAGHLNG